MKDRTISLLLGALVASCSPLRTSPHDEQHQLELKLHEVQTNLDDLRHDINCFQTEIQILDGRIKHFENGLSQLKQQEIEKHQAKIDQLFTDLRSLENRWNTFEKTSQEGKDELFQLTTHANTTRLALSQFKDKIEDLEEAFASHNRKFEEFAKLKGHIERLAETIKEPFKIYRVKPKDSLEKIAKTFHTDPEKIRELNHLKSDLIFVGQELKIPVE